MQNDSPNAQPLAALRHDRIEAPWLLDGPIDGETFRAYVEEVLVPTPRPGDIVIMDKRTEHKKTSRPGAAFEIRSASSIKLAGTGNRFSCDSSRAPARRPEKERPPEGGLLIQTQDRCSGETE
jgi:hypothetical protein